MNDLQICQRVAVIDGHIVDEDDKYPRGVLTKHGKVVGYVNLDYLNDDALCFQLMVKYRVEIDYDACRVCTWYAKYNSQTMVDMSFRGKVDKVAEPNYKEVNKAILLAIIEAHEE